MSNNSANGSNKNNKQQPAKNNNKQAKQASTPAVPEPEVAPELVDNAVVKLIVQQTRNLRQKMKQLS